MTTTTEIAPVITTRRFGGLREFWHYFSQSRGAVLGLIIYVLLILVALTAPLITPHDANEQFKPLFLLPPAWAPGSDPRFLLGTDPVGRDILSRLIFGSQFSLRIGVSVVTLSVIGGITLGLLAGYFRGWVDVASMRVMDLILAFPPLLLALVLVTILGPGLINAMLAIALTLQPYFARLVRAAVMAEKNREYVTSARLAGAGHFRLMVMTILTSTLAPLIVQATLCFSDAILAAAALGGLGRGARPPAPEGGARRASAREGI